MCHYIKPKSVDSYLSGVCNQLEPFFPDVRANRQHRLVVRTIQGCKKLRPSPPSRKRPLAQSDLEALSREHLSSQSYNDNLFFTLLLTGFHGLLHLAELVWPDHKNLQDYWKIILCNSVRINQNSFEFFLPGHKADCFFKGNEVIIQATECDNNPLSLFITYLCICDQRFPFQPELWLREDSSIPTRSRFIRRLHHHFASDVGGHSMCAGGAMALAEAGIPPHMIQAIGCWSSEAFQIYIRHHPVLLASLLFGLHSPKSPSS
ncbi:hypothetical protein L208DRAFT_1556783 [Tricholoma matsutake]|nr:hypothetical protein L208DRAFT_1556783 [Tricholoma matsutake 945]